MIDAGRNQFLIYACISGRYKGKTRLIQQKYDVAVIGAGLSGLTAAYYLSKRGFKIILVEKNPELGGILTSYRIGAYFIEKYYHHLFKKDVELISLINEIGLNKDLEWKKASTGFYVDGKVFRQDTPIDIVKYSPLSLIDKLRLAKIYLKIKNIDNYGSYDQVPAKKWVIDQVGNGVFQTFFEPLFLGKFGSAYDHVSAAWLIDRIQARSHRSVFGEKLGYLKYGFEILIRKITDKIKENDGEIITRSKVHQILLCRDRVQGIKVNNKEIKSDFVISTTSPSSLLQLCKFSVQFESKLKRIKYQGVICLLLGIRNRLQETYWLNIKAKNIPFAALIEHTNFHMIPEYDANLVYLPAYFPSQGATRVDAQDTKDIFLKGLKSMFPSFKEDDVLWWKIAIETESSPIYSIGYLDDMPSCKSPIDGLYLAGMTLSYPNRGMNFSVRSGLTCVDLIKRKQQGK